MIFKTLRRHWDLIPMIAAVSAGCIGATSYTIYAALTKPDVRWNRSSELPPFERIDPTKKTEDNFSKEITIFKTLRRHWDLIPMVAAVSAGCIGATSYTIYAALTKPDVRWNRSSELPPFERIDPTKKQKLLIISQEYKPIEELQKLRAEIGPYKD